jgi:hypothetical protein
MRARGWHPRNWPVTLKVPILVAGLMVGVSLLVTDRVLERLVDTQERHLDALAGAYLDGLSSAILPDVLRADVWEVFDAPATPRAFRPGPPCRQGRRSERRPTGSSSMRIAARRGFAGSCSTRPARWGRFTRDSTSRTCSLSGARS